LKWLVIIVFATYSGDFYVFTNPKFDTREQCMAALDDPDQRFKMVLKIMEEYGRPMPVRFANCLDEEEIKEILEETGSLNTDRKV